MAQRATLLRPPEAAPGTGREAGRRRRIRAESCEGGHARGLGGGRKCWRGMTWRIVRPVHGPVHVSPRHLKALRRGTPPRFPSVGPTPAAVKPAACSVRAPRPCCTAPCTWCGQTGCRHHRMAPPACADGQPCMCVPQRCSKQVPALSLRCVRVCKRRGRGQRGAANCRPTCTTSTVPDCSAQSARCLRPAAVPSASTEVSSLLRAAAQVSRLRGLC